MMNNVLVCVSNTAWDTIPLICLPAHPYSPHWSSTFTLPLIPDEGDGLWLIEV
jgi:hypothetical protein